MSVRVCVCVCVLVAGKLLLDNMNTAEDRCRHLPPSTRAEQSVCVGGDVFCCVCTIITDLRCHIVAPSDYLDVTSTPRQREACFGLFLFITRFSLL